MDYRTQLEHAKKSSTAQLLFRCARQLNHYALAQLPADTARPRPAHTALFPHIDLEGTRLGVIADRLGISKQAVGQLVDDLEQMQMVERIPDPSDGRARLVVFSAKGREKLLEGLVHLQAIESEIEAAIGAGPMADLHAALTALDGFLANKS